MARLINNQQPKRMLVTNGEIERILNGCRLNQRGAQKELYVLYYNYAMSIAFRYSSSHDNAVEMTNDAFLKIYTGLKSFVPRHENTVASFMAWFKKVVVNASIDYVRKYRNKELMANVDTEHLAIADEGENAQQMLQHKQIIKCVRQLSPAYKAVFNLYIIEGFSHFEIAGKLNISEGTSKSNLHKARQNLQVLLEKGQYN